MFKKRILVRVTQKDIEKGKKYSLTQCPIAIALYRELKNKVKDDTFEYVSVSTKEVYALFDNGTHASIGVTTKKMEHFINAYDKGEKVKPHRFYFFFTQKG